MGAPSAAGAAEVAARWLGHVEVKALYEQLYCQRGEMENRIKEQQLALFADRTSSTKWRTNQYRALLAALAYSLLETMRRTALRGTDLVRAQCQTLRMRLLRIGGWRPERLRSGSPARARTKPCSDCSYTGAPPPENTLRKSEGRAHRRM